jgi:hypothetical protein
MYLFDTLKQGGIKPLLVWNVDHLITLKFSDDIDSITYNIETDQVVTFKIL